MVSEKHFVNNPSDLVKDSILGLVSTSTHLKFDEESKVIYLRNIDDVKESQVTLFCGGGAGHEPAHGGFVGPSFLTSAVSGHVFASPSTSQVLSCLQRTYSPNHGTIVIVKNYTGDILNFGRAIERFKAEEAGKGSVDCKVSMVVVGDDVGVVNESEEIDVGRRGLSGTVLVNKIACGSAASGESFENVERIAKFAAENVFTIGCALDPASVPGQGLPRVLETSQIEFGMGIHNEPGFKTTELKSGHEMVSDMISHVFNSKLLKASSQKLNSKKVVLLVNNLGAISNLELGLVSNEACNEIKKHGFEIVRAFQGTFMTGLAMPGASISVLVVPSSSADEQEILKFIDLPAHAPGWNNLIPVADKSSKSDAIVDNERRANLASQTSNKTHERSEMWVKISNSVYDSSVVHEQEITYLDSVMGDGDCGQVLLSGTTSVKNAANSSKIPSNNIAAAVSTISGLLEDSMGGTSGIIYCLFFDGVSQHLSKAGYSSDNGAMPSAEVWGEALSNGLETIQRYSTAKVGDRTLIDALHPFIETFKASGGDLAQSLESAKQGAKKTEEMVPLRGRAVYTGKGKGHADAGAVGVCAVIEGILNALH
ncbi:hypothetical protein BB559_007561 [Furculomyces boomerangus]|uniref:Dihydroxyacetone kinase n=1 Tax=Furculomyces boomerangus TaxID=61424 RepID=A0A2T9XWW9_9FUNG|nr:hypothetical protein BB559_007561 [Furculomyces boomerangus]